MAQLATAAATVSTTVRTRVAVVTGASSGIGEAAARVLDASGYKVALLARRLHRITALAEEPLPVVRVTLIEPGVLAAELPDLITHADSKHAVGRLYDQAEVTAADVADVIDFVLSRPRRLVINEVLLRPAAQQ